MSEKKVVSRWVVITLPEKFNKHKKLYKDLLHPVIQKYKGILSKCVEDGFTESEYKFKDLATAKECCKILKKILKENVIKTDKSPSPFLLGANVMPLSYEKYGARSIIRPDYSTDYDKRKTQVCKNFWKTF
jgi:hypothetical protein